MNHSNQIAVVAVAAASALGAASAGAAEGPDVRIAPATAVLSSPAATAPELAFGAPVSPARLAARRGAAGGLSDMQLRGVVSDNRAVNVTTGTNAISDGAFSGMAGLPMIVQNTGNNVLIQNATIINVQLK